MSTRTLSRNNPSVLVGLVAWTKRTRVECTSFTGNGNRRKLTRGARFEPLYNRLGGTEKKKKQNRCSARMRHRWAWTTRCLAQSWLLSLLFFRLFGRNRVHCAALGHARVFLFQRKRKARHDVSNSVSEVSEEILLFYTHTNIPRY